MHPSQTIPLLLVSLYPSHVHFTLPPPSVVRPLVVPVSISIRVAGVLYFPFPGPVSAISVRLFRGSGSFTFPVDSMRKPPQPGELVRIVWREAIPDRTSSEFFAPSPASPSRAGRLSCHGSIFRGQLYTIIGHRKQCARPGKRMQVLANRLANYVKRDVRAMLGYLGEIASRILLPTRPVMRDKSGNS